MGSFGPSLTLLRALRNPAAFPCCHTQGLYFGEIDRHQHTSRLGESLVIWTQMAAAYSLPTNPALPHWQGTQGAPLTSPLGVPKGILSPSQQELSDLPLPPPYTQTTPVTLTTVPPCELSSLCSSAWRISLGGPAEICRPGRQSGP